MFIYLPYDWIQYAPGQPFRSRRNRHGARYPESFRTYTGHVCCARTSVRRFIFPHTTRIRTCFGRKTAFLSEKVSLTLIRSQPFFQEKTGCLYRQVSRSLNMVSRSSSGELSLFRIYVPVFSAAESRCTAFRTGFFAAVSASSDTGFCGIYHSYCRFCIVNAESA